MTSQAPAAGAQTSRAEFVGMWRRVLPWWHAMYAVIWVAALAMVLLNPVGRWGRLVEVGALIGMGAAYAALGLRAIKHYDVRWGVAYHLVSWSLLFTLQIANPQTQSWVFFFVLFAHLWAMLETWQAVGGTIAVGLAFGGAEWWHQGFARDELPQVLSASVVSMGISLGLGLFVNHMVREAEQRADTIDELRTTQDRLALAERDRGVTEERERLSREIHDTLAQGFTSVLTMTRAAQAALERGDTTVARERLAMVEATAADNLREARLIVAELTPGHLQSRTLVEALDRLVDTVRDQTHLPVAFDVTGQPRPLGGSSEVVLLRSAQEALSNVRRHARAGRVQLSLTYLAEQVELVVLDDGVGFDQATVATGYGLDGLAARAEELGGSAVVESQPGHGTRVRVKLPVGEGSLA